MEEQHGFDDWLDAALGEYGDSAASFGFETRTIAKLRQRLERRRMRIALSWTVGAMAAAALAVFLAGILQLTIGQPDPIRAAVSVPRVEKVTLSAATTHPLVARHTPGPRQTRGVPILPVPLTHQEIAVLRTIRNARAHRLAMAAPAVRDLSQEGSLLEFRDLEIPPVIKEGER